MNNASNSLNNQYVSLGDKVQIQAIECNNDPAHPLAGPLAGRLYAVIVKPIARIADVSIHIIFGVGKLLVGTVLLPINFAVWIVRGKGLDTDWTVRQGIFHFGYAAFYAVDILVSPIVNLISPNIYPDNRYIAELQRRDVRDQQNLQDARQAQDEAARWRREYTLLSEQLSAKEASYQCDNNLLLANVQRQDTTIRVLQEQNASLQTLLTEMEELLNLNNECLTRSTQLPNMYSSLPPNMYGSIPPNMYGSQQLVDFDTMFQSSTLGDAFTALTGNHQQFAPEPPPREDEADGNSESSASRVPPAPLPRDGELLPFPPPPPLPLMPLPSFVPSAPAMISPNLLMSGFNRLGTKIREFVWLRIPDFSDEAVSRRYKGEVGWAQSQKSAIKQSKERLQASREKLQEIRQRLNFCELTVESIVDEIKATCVDENEDMADDADDQLIPITFAEDSTLQSMALPQRVKRYKTAIEIAAYFDCKFDEKDQQIARSLVYVNNIILGKQQSNAAHRAAREQQEREEALQAKELERRAAELERKQRCALDEARDLLWNNLQETTKNAIAFQKRNEGVVQYNPREYNFSDLALDRNIKPQERDAFLKALRARQDYIENFAPFYDKIEALFVVEDS